MSESSFDHLDALLVESLFPLLLLLCTFGGASLRQRLYPKLAKPHVLSLFMHFLTFVLPVISRRICQSFRCVTYDAGDEGELSYLMADSSMDCTSPQYWWVAPHH